MVFTRNYPVVIGAGVAVLMFSLMGAAAITGVLPASNADSSALALEKTAAAAAASKAACRTCGVIAAVKAVEVKSDSSSASSVYRVTVRMDDGSERTLSQAAAPAFAVGARVRVNGHLLEHG
jgi:outer membrane lipoprotein SlyB